MRLKSAQILVDNLEENLSSRWDVMASLKASALKSKYISVRSFEANLQALVVMQYANYEGYVKYSFSELAKFLNKLELKNRAAPNVLKEANFCKKLFDEINKKSIKSVNNIFGLYRIFRDGTFNHDSKIYETSNLYPETIIEWLDHLNLKTDIISEKSSILTQLVMKRNNIAHGSSSPILSLDEFHKYQESSDAAMMHVCTELGVFCNIHF